MMNPVQEIQEDLISSSMPLSKIMRKASILAYRLGSEDFIKWVDNELNGYHESPEPIPNYRKSITHSLGDFVGPFHSVMRNTPIPTINLPEGYEDYSRTLIIADGIQTLETLLEDKSPSFRMYWNPDFVAVIADQIYSNWQCVTAWQILSRGTIEQILGAIGNRLLKFVLELEKIQPDIGELAPGEKSDIPNETLTQLFQTFIIGGQNTVNAGLTTVKGDFNMGDKFDMSGDFSGSIVNVKSTLVGVHQSIDLISDTRLSIKDELHKLISQLEEELIKVPPGNEEEAEAVAESAKGLVEEAAKNEPNKTLIKIKADGLKAAAKNIAAITPTVLAIASQIVETIMEFSGKV